MSIFEGRETKGRGRTARMLFRALGAEIDDVLVIVPTESNAENAAAFMQRVAPCLVEQLPGVFKAGDGRTITIRTVDAER